MVVPPGYSVSDLIQALAHVKKIYDAFCDEHTSSAVQLNELADDIEQFRTNLKQHKEIVEQRGLEYAGYKAVERTLTQCTELLDDYRAVVDDRRRKSIIGAFKTAKFAYEQDKIQRLRNQIARHENNIVIASLNIVLSESSNHHHGNKQSPAISIPARVPENQAPCISPPETPHLLDIGSPLMTQDGFRTADSSRSRSSSQATSSYNEKSPSSQDNTPTTPTQHYPPSGSSSIFHPSPQMTSVPEYPEDGLTMPDLILPQPALPYRVANVIFGSKQNGKGKLQQAPLKWKPVGRNLLDGSSGRELIIIDEDRKEKFRHKIRTPNNLPCYPYTWHSKWHKGHSCLEVCFKGKTIGSHSISIKQAPSIHTTPYYIFTEEKDFEDFQSCVRGLDLFDVYEIREITSGSPPKKREATDQHLKIWHDQSSDSYSLSFYANAAATDRDLEFPIYLFKPDPILDNNCPYDVRLNFLIHGKEGKEEGMGSTQEVKRARTFSTAFGLSSSPSETTTASSGMTQVPRVFSWDVGVGQGSESSASTVESRLSVTSMGSESGRSQITLSPDLGPSVETQAKHMKSLNVEFTEESEAKRFVLRYKSIYHTDTPPSSAKGNLVMDWAKKAGQARRESLLSTSPGTTPFNRSPELVGMVGMNMGQGRGGVGYRTR